MRFFRKHDPVPRRCVGFVLLRRKRLGLAGDRGMTGTEKCFFSGPVLPLNCNFLLLCHNDTSLFIF